MILTGIARFCKQWVYWQQNTAGIFPKFRCRYETFWCRPEFLREIQVEIQANLPIRKYFTCQQQLILCSLISYDHLFVKVFNICLLQHEHRWYFCNFHTVYNTAWLAFSVFLHEYVAFQVTNFSLHNFVTKSHWQHNSNRHSYHFDKQRDADPSNCYLPWLTVISLYILS